MVVTLSGRVSGLRPLHVFDVLYLNERARPVYDLLSGGFHSTVESHILRRLTVWHLVVLDG